MARRGGWRRLGRKRVRYVDSRGRAITDDEQLGRIRSLVIPPAWTDVWISPSPGAKLQASGLDAAGRRQYIYHSSFRAARERAKFERLLHFAEFLPALRARTAQDLRLGPYERDWACAIAVGLVNHGWFRVGSERHARASRTYGITTLTKRHVSITGKDIELRFRTKNKRLVRRRVDSAALARGLRLLVGLENGARLFRFEQDGEIVNLTAPMLNEYIGEHLGNGFTAKDFRTWGGTLLAAVELAKHGPPKDEDEAKRVLAEVMRKVAHELGNTPAVARASYVSPLVVEHYLAGSTLEDFRRKSPRPARLRADERALLRLLRSDARPRRPGSARASRANTPL
jgi:DNA topoisomerase I